MLDLDLLVSRVFRTDVIGNVFLVCTYPKAARQVLGVGTDPDECLLTCNTDYV